MTSAVMPTYARFDLEFDRGEGCYLYTVDGRRFLDFTSGIAVNALGHAHPHLVKTLQEQAGKLPLGRLGTPDDIGSTVAFLASSSADYITGAILRVDGGFVHKHCRAEKS